MEDVHDANFLYIFGNAKDCEVVVDCISAISHAGEYGVAAEFVCGGELLKVGIAFFNPVRKACRRLWVFEFVCDVFNKSTFADGEITTLYMKRRPLFRQSRLCVESLPGVDFRFRFRNGFVQCLFRHQLVVKVNADQNGRAISILRQDDWAAFKVAFHIWVAIA